MGQASMRKWVRRALDRHPDLAGGLLVGDVAIRAVLERARQMRLEHRHLRQDYWLFLELTRDMRPRSAPFRTSNADGSVIAQAGNLP